MRALDIAHLHHQGLIILPEKVSGYFIWRKDCPVFHCLRYGIWSRLVCLSCFPRTCSKKKIIGICSCIQDEMTHSVTDLNADGCNIIFIWLKYEIFNQVLICMKGSQTA